MRTVPTIPGAFDPAGLRVLRRDAARIVDSKPGRVLVWLIVAVSFLFAALPGLDRLISNWFFESGRFPLADDPALGLLRHLNVGATIVACAGSALILVLQACRSRIRVPVAPHRLLYVLAVFALGPGLLVNAVLKPGFGRARPRDIAEFGGPLDFSHVWEVSRACVGNCSFTSGEAASASALFALLCLLPAGSRIARRAMTILLAALVAAFSINRIAFGAHFASDTLLSILLVLLLMRGLVPAFFGPAGERIDAYVRAGLHLDLAALSGRLAQGPFFRHIGRAIDEIGNTTAWPFRATSRRSSSPIPAGSTPRSS